MCTIIHLNTGQNTFHFKTLSLETFLIRRNSQLSHQRKYTRKYSPQQHQLTIFSNLAERSQSHCKGKPLCKVAEKQGRIALHLRYFALVFISLSPEKISVHSSAY